MEESHAALMRSKIGKGLEKVSVPTPMPGPQELLVRVHIAGLNPHAALVRDNVSPKKDLLSHSLGVDIVGFVMCAGIQTNDFGKYARVVAQGSMNSLQECAIVQVWNAVKVQDGAFSDEELATLPTNLISSVIGLFDESGLGIPAPWMNESKGFDYASTSLLIVGGGSNCGKYAVQLAHLAGIGKIVVVASAKREQELLSYGATDVVDDRWIVPEELVSRIREVVGDDLIYAFDTVNTGFKHFIAVNCLSNFKKGKLARLQYDYPFDDTRVSKEKTAGYELKNVLGSLYAHAKVSRPFWKKLPEYLTTGTIKPIMNFQTIRGFDVDAVNERLDSYTAGTLTGQVQVDLREPQAFAV